jgi:hypothetical protein
VGIKGIHFDTHVTEVHRTTEVPDLLTRKFSCTSSRFPLVKKDRAVKDVFADAHVEESVLHWTDDGFFCN